MARLASNTTILIAPGTYTLTSTLYINGTFTNVALRGASGNADDVVLVGPGMTNAELRRTFRLESGVGGNVQGITIANLTIRDVYYHPIIFNAGAQSPRIYNVRLVNAGQQFIKANPDGAGGGVNNGIVEYSVIEYDTTSRDDYTNGVDVHTGDELDHSKQPVPQHPRPAGPARRAGDPDVERLVEHHGRRKHVHRLPA